MHRERTRLDGGVLDSPGRGLVRPNQDVRSLGVSVDFDDDLGRAAGQSHGGIEVHSTAPDLGQGCVLAVANQVQMHGGGRAAADMGVRSHPE